MKPQSNQNLSGAGGGQRAGVGLPAQAAGGTTGATPGSGIRDMIGMRDGSASSACLMELERYLVGLEPWLDLSSSAIRENLGAVLEDAKHGRSSVSELLLRLVTEGDRLVLRGATLRVTDHRCLWILLNEVLYHEDYFFETDSACPRILDCGSHFGLAVYYFKRLFPKSRVTAFEPVPRNIALLLENLSDNAWDDVELVPHALDRTSGHRTLYISDIDSMAASLTERRLLVGDPVQEHTAQTVKLSSFLDEPVDFLKLDIEGSEDCVLEEAGDRLYNVRSMFIEYHHGVGLAGGRLVRILSLLDRCGFDYHLDKSFSLYSRTAHRPMTHASEGWSASIWARRRKE